MSDTTLSVNDSAVNHSAVNDSALPDTATDENLSLRERYERDGYLLIEDVLSPAECQELKAEGLRILAENTKPGTTVFVGVANAGTRYYRLASDERIVSVLREIMPDGVMFMSDKFVFKSGDHRFGTPWHCDKAYWPGTRPKLSVWIALDDVSAENGALKVLPGGHKREWNHGDNHEQEFTMQIEVTPEDEKTEVICEMRAGGMIFFSDNLPHASTENTAGIDRYALISTYHAPAPDDEFDHLFTARHVIVPAPQ